MRLSLGTQPGGAEPVVVHQLPVQPQLLVHLVVQESLLAVVALHFLQESRQAGDLGGGRVGLLASHVEEVAASRAAAASDVVQVGGGDRGGGTVTRGEAFGKDGRF